MIDGHGDDLHNYKDIKYNFSSNVFHGDLDQDLLIYLQDKVHMVANYPPTDFSYLADPLAAKLSISSDQLLFTNGATEAFYLFAQCYARKKGMIVIPSFSEYEDAAKAHHQNITFVSHDDVTSRTITDDVVYIGNPNNPDGKVIPIDQIENLLGRNPNTVFMVDEAYIEFTGSTKSCVPLIIDHDNLVIIKSFTKVFSIPGLRLGYMLSCGENIQKFRKLTIPWNVNVLAVEAGKFILDNYERLSFNKKKLLQQAGAFFHQLTSIGWLKPYPSHTHYFLIELQKGKASQLKRYLAEKHHILIRDANNFRGLEGEHIRLTMQNEEANLELMAALNAWTIN